jgi:sugar phosphate isomerase/epimerase
MVSRREFLKTAACVSAASLILPLSSYRIISKNTPGLILYTVRDEMKKNPAQTLEKIASIGYKNIESAGYELRKYYGMKPVVFKELVESFGMKMVSGHHSINSTNLNEVVEDAAYAGLEYAVLPFVDTGNLDYFKSKAEEFNKFGEAFKKAGIRFAYHNHDFEFKKIKGQIPYDILLKNTDPQKVAFEMDLYWISKAGYDPLAYFKQYQGRFELWHVKDMKNNAKKSFTEVGNGTIDFAKIFSAKELSGMKYYFVEEDKCVDHKPLDSIKISLDYIKDKKF